MDSAKKQVRFHQLQLEELNDQQRAVADEIMKVSSVGIGGPYNPMLRSPVLAERMFKVLDYLRFNTSVPRHLNEFCILIQARLWTSQVEWLAHYPLAIKEGLPQPILDDLKQGKRPSSMNPEEAAVYDYCTELSKSHEVSDTTYQGLRQLFSEQQIVDLTTTCGLYVTLAMLMNAVEQAVPPGKTPPLQAIPAR